jgi:hypothetical protein
MLKMYRYNGRLFQFEEGRQPAGAVELKKVVKPEKKIEEPEVKVAEPEVKAAEPKTKARKPSNKSGKAVTK